MPVKKDNNLFRYYMHDGPHAFSFELSGVLAGAAVGELAQAWRTASSTVRGQAFVIDLSYVTEVDEAGQRMLRQWFESGAELVAKWPAARAIIRSITGQAPGGSQTGDRSGLARIC